MSRFDPRHQDSITVHKLSKCVSDGISSPADADGLHHAGVTQLTDTELSVEQLKNGKLVAISTIVGETWRYRWSRL